MVEISERILRLAKEGGWIGVDFDGTLFTYYEWFGWNVFGEPIKPMIDRVKAWLTADVGVRIVTARVGLPLHIERPHPLGGIEIVVGPSLFAHHICRVTGKPFSDAMMIRAIQDHLELHELPRLEVQPHKDVNMIEFWDDRAIQVIANTGRTLAEEYEAKESAEELPLLGKLGQDHF